ncbi:MAG: MFS transporter [Clostridiales Family XIII bacterium]|nr:MFS transporter [Clostridiales Family XIII bacterium]
MKNKWLYLIILYVSATAVSFGQLKLVPIQGELPEFSTLMSIFTIAGIILAIPGGLILAKLGPRKLLLLLLGMLIVGNVIGAVSDLPAMLIAGRVIEGISFAMIIMVGMVLINIWFADGGAGTATGIFTTFAAIGSFVCMNIGLPLTNAMGAKAMWWFVAAFTAVCFLLVLFIIKAPEAPPGEEAPETPKIGKALKNLPVWFIAICQLCVSFLLYGYIYLYPALFQMQYGLSVETANLYNSINGLCGIPACVIGGVLISKTGKPFVVLLIGCLGAILTAALNMSLGSGAAIQIAHLIMCSFFIGGFALTANLCIVPILAKSPAYIGYSMAIINMCYFIGISLCTPMILAMVNVGGWQQGTLLMVGVAVVAMIFAVLAMTASRKKLKQEAA